MAEREVGMNRRLGESWMPIDIMEKARNDLETVLLDISNFMIAFNVVSIFIVAYVTREDSGESDGGERKEAPFLFTIINLAIIAFYLLSLLWNRECASELSATCRRIERELAPLIESRALQAQAAASTKSTVETFVRTIRSFYARNFYLASVGMILDVFCILVGCKFAGLGIIN